MDTKEKIGQIVLKYGGLCYLIGRERENEEIRLPDVNETINAIFDEIAIHLFTRFQKSSSEISIQKIKRTLDL